MLGVRLDEALEARLKALAEKRKRSKSYLAKEALTRYIAEEERKDYEHEIALARWERYQASGEAIDGRRVQNWLDTWGDNDEQPWPQK